MDLTVAMSWIGLVLSITRESMKAFHLIIGSSVQASKRGSNNRRTPSPAKLGGEQIRGGRPP